MGFMNKNNKNTIRPSVNTGIVLNNDHNVEIIKPLTTHSSGFPQCKKTMAGTNKPLCTASGVSSHVTVASHLAIIPTSSGAEISVKSCSKCQSFRIIVQLNGTYTYCTICGSPNISLSVDFYPSITERVSFSVS